MEIGVLREFIAAVEEKSFSSAAKRACVTQPTLSRHVEMLEREVGASLFDRSAFGASPTRAGRLLYERVVDIVRSWDAAAAEARAVNAEEHVVIGGNLRDSGIMMLASSAASLAMRELAGVRIDLDAHHASVDHAELAAHDVTDALETGEADVVLALADRTYDWGGLEARELCDAALCAYASARHPLAERRGLAVADFEGYPVMHLGIHDTFGEGVRTMYARAGITCEERQRLPLTESDMLRARDDREVMWLPDGVSQRIPAAEISGLVRLDVSDPAAAMRVWAVWKRDADTVAALVRILVRLASAGETTGQSRA